MKYLCQAIITILLFFRLNVEGFEAHSSSSFNSEQFFSKRTIQSTPVLFQELDNYIAQHNVENLLKEGTEFCNRKFIVATYACPQAIGNHMHEFLNAYAGAFITNRTLVWKFCTRKPCQLDSEQDCDQYLSRLSWIASYHTVVRIWKEKKCDGDTNEYHLIPQKFRFQSIKIFMCCGIDHLPFSFLDYGTHELHELHSLVLNQSRLDYNHRRRAHILFDNGEDFGYGVLLRSSFRFKDVVISNNNRSLLHGLSNYHDENPSSKAIQTTHDPHQDILYIGIHLRHSSMDDVVGSDHGEFYCMRELIAKYNPYPTNKRCVILLATDRPRMIELWQNRSMTEFNCTTITTNHTYSLFFNRPEHGPFTGEIAMHDIELVSRADIFLGSAYTSQNLRGSTSTYSLLIASLRATNGRPLAISDPSYWLPSCGHALGNKIVPDGPYTDKTFLCGNCVNTGILLPEHCPYWNKTSLEENDGKPWVT